MAKALLCQRGCGRHQGSVDNTLFAKYPDIMRNILVLNITKCAIYTTIFLCGGGFEIIVQNILNKCWKTESLSQNHRMMEVGRELWRLSSHLRQPSVSARKSPGSGLGYRPAIRPLKLREWIVLRWKCQLKEWTKQMVSR